MTVLEFYESYPGGRIVGRMGAHDVGAVFPPTVKAGKGERWRWCFWLRVAPREGFAGSEQDAKKDLNAEALKWVREAGLK